MINNSLIFNNFEHHLNLSYFHIKKNGYVTKNLINKH